MTHEEITNGLLQLGFIGGWVLTGKEITVWENDAPKPTNKAIQDAAAIYQETLDNAAAVNAASKAALLDRLGITAEEATLLLS
jgi:hypothetical protein